MSAAVVSTSVIGSAAMSIQWGRGRWLQSGGYVRGRCGHWRRTRARRSGRSPDPVIPRPRGAAAVMMARQSGYASECRVVRPPCTTENIENRQRHRDRDSLKDAEQSHTQKGRDREQELDAPLAPEPYGPRDVSQRKRRRDNDSGECRLGRFFRSPGTNTSISTITAAPTTPVSCVLAPACSATAVRDPLVLTGNPWKKPAATFAAPIPTISPLPLSSCLVRVAKAEAVEIVSVSATSAIPSAPATSSGRSDTDTDARHRQRWEPLGKGSDKRDAMGAKIEHR